MKYIFFLLSILVIFSVSACKKSSTSTDNGTGAAFKFSNLVAKDSVIKVNYETSITALATGDGLTYKWTVLYGTISGNGATVTWTVCHEDKFSITCQVTDKYNHTDTKQVYVRAKN